jgi:hypothetical protein
MRYASPNINDLIASVSPAILNLIVKVIGFHRFISDLPSPQQKIGTIDERDTLASCRTFQEFLRMLKLGDAQADLFQLLGGKRSPSLLR